MRPKQKHRIAGIDLFIISATVTLFLLTSCRHEQKAHHDKTPAIKASIKKAIAKAAPLNNSFENGRDSIAFFDINLLPVHKNDTVGFVSVSDIDQFPGSVNTPADSVDQLVIPDLEGKKPEETSYFTLTSKYRKRLFEGTKLAETDTLFVYDYSKDVLLKFPVSSLKAVASLSPYEDEMVAMHSARDYMLGFELDRSALSGLNNVSVFIGPADPFIRGQMHPVIWQSIAAAKFPSVNLTSEEVVTLKAYKLSGTYDFALNGYQYYLQKFVDAQQPAPLTSLRLIIINAANKVVFNTLFYESEGESPAPMSFAGNSTNSLEQWTGQLLKNRPPLILGFEYIDFGCPVLPFIDGSGKFVSLNCDNRH